MPGLLPATRTRYISFLVCNSTTQHYRINSSNPQTQVEVGAHAVRKKPGRNSVVWSGQVLEEYKQRKREKTLKFIRKAEAFEIEK